jgi:hypothetical protein
MKKKNLSELYLSLFPASPMSRLVALCTVHVNPFMLANQICHRHGSRTSEMMVKPIQINEDAYLPFELSANRAR